MQESRPSTAAAGSLYTPPQGEHHIDSGTGEDYTDYREDVGLLPPHPAHGISSSETQALEAKTFCDISAGRKNRHARLAVGRVLSALCLSPGYNGIRSKNGEFAPSQQRQKEELPRFQRNTWEAQKQQA